MLSPFPSFGHCSKSNGKWLRPASSHHEHPMLALTLQSRPLFFLFCTTLLFSAAGCAGEKVIQGETFEDLTPHQTYALSLQNAGLHETALGAAWLDAGKTTPLQATSIEFPFREVGFFDPTEVSSRSYYIEVDQGQRLDVAVRLDKGEEATLFVDLFETPEDSSAALRHVAAADSMQVIRVEAKRPQRYLLRVQPELLRGGRYTLDIRVDASLGFPVAGKSTSAIQSFWGAPRDGGERTHKGVDIFARKGTPVVAIAPGYVARIDETPRGGKVIWVRDAFRNQAYYYAHLDEHWVAPNSRVMPGDSLGTVGNTGNAITTPPHLHFGIYTTRRAVDPYPYISPVNQEPPQLAASMDQLGKWVRVKSEVARLRKGPGRTHEYVDELPEQTALHVRSIAGSWYHVALPDGRKGFVLGRLTEDAQDPLQSMQLIAGRPVRLAASQSAISIDSVATNSEVDVFGRFGNYVGITAPSGKTGWISMD